jgi:hypothetical protein
MKNQIYWISFIFFIGANCLASDLKNFNTAELIDAKKIAEDRIDILKQYNEIHKSIRPLDDIKKQRQLLRQLYQNSQTLEITINNEISNSYTQNGNGNKSSQCLKFADSLKKTSRQFYLTSYQIVNTANSNDIKGQFYRHKFELVFLQLQALKTLFENSSEGGETALLKEKIGCHWKNHDNVMLQLKNFIELTNQIKLLVLGQTGIDQLMNSLQDFSQQAIQYFEYEKKIMLPKMILSAAIGATGLSLIKNYPVLKLILKSSFGLYWGLKASGLINLKQTQISELEQINLLINWTQSLEVESSLALIEVLSTVKKEEFELKLKVLDQLQKEYSFITRNNSVDQQHKLEEKLKAISFELKLRSGEL